MTYESHSLKLGFTELYKLMFKKKNCPVCSRPRKRNKQKIDLGERWYRDTDSDADGISFKYGQKYDYKYFYYCEHCDIETPLKDI